MVLVGLMLRCTETAKIVEKYAKRKFIDTLRLYVKGGSGGMGYPKYGGIGGAGGDIYVTGKEGKTLKDVLNDYKAKRITAGHGENAHKNRILGQKGMDVVIEAPTGISLYNENGSHIGEVNNEGDKVLIAKGGIGGRVETGYCGLKGQSCIVTLDLKLIADVGLIGFPNAGKSTLLAAISNAKPKIASYPFTTVQPNIGLINYPDLRQISVADIPGLIEGAHKNFGMGHKFLKHIERTKLLIFIVDIGGFQLSHKYSSRSCLETIVLLNKELELYREDLLDRPAILILNKMDKKNATSLAGIIIDAMKDLEGVFQEVPSHLKPNKALDFQQIICMSAKQQNEHEIENVKTVIRQILDTTVQDDMLEKEVELLEKLEKSQRVMGPVMI